MYVHHKVAEDGQSLYGVPTFEALKMFEMLITVSGVGPKVALAVLSQLPVATVQQAISNQDASTFTRISGIGGKTAERIILDLKGKVLSVPGTPGGQVTGEVFDALLALGYSQTEVRAVLPKLPPSGSVGEQIKLALQHFSKK
jgi:Holliday junction DNA helicase RuvA